MTILRISLLALWSLGLLTTSGCLGGKAVLWQPPPIPLTIATADGGPDQLLAAAALADRWGDGSATDAYFAAAVLAWRQLSAERSFGRQPSSALAQTYRMAVAR